MRTTVLAGLIAMMTVAFAQDEPSNSNATILTPEQTTRGTLEFRQEPVTPPASQSLPRVDTWHWMEKVTPRDRDLVAPWEVRRMNNFSIIEPPAMAGDFNSTSR